MYTFNCGEGCYGKTKKRDASKQIENKNISLEVSPGDVPQILQVIYYIVR